MKTLASVLLVSLLAACGSPSRRIPVDVAMMPTDCANRIAVINWYNTQLAIPRQTLESVEDYERYQAQVRYRIWHLRYNCQPV